MKSTDFFRIVTKHITRVRDQGGKPNPDINEISLEKERYVCDLCKQKLDESEIIQCGLCGRWICKEDCWNKEHSACENCTGTIKLMKESFLISGMVSDKSTSSGVKSDIQDIVEEIIGKIKGRKTKEQTEKRKQKSD